MFETSLLSKTPHILKEKEMPNKIRIFSFGKKDSNDFIYFLFESVVVCHFLLMEWVISQFSNSIVILFSFEGHGIGKSLFGQSLYFYHQNDTFDLSFPSKEHPINIFLEEGAKTSLSFAP